jgi:hypothetical protein
MDAIATVAAGAAAVEGTTVYCTVAGTDQALAPVAAVRHVTVATYAANLGSADGGSTVWTIPGVGAFTSDATPTAAEIETGLNALTGIAGVSCAASSGTAVVTCTYAAGSGVIGTGTHTVTSTLTDADGTNATMTSVALTAGVDGITNNFVDDDPTANYVISNYILSNDTGTDGAVVNEHIYTKWTYDSGDAFTLGTDGEIATAVSGASEAQFETEAASLTGESGATPMTISYRTGALTTGISVFQLGS